MKLLFLIASTFAFAALSGCVAHGHHRLPQPHATKVVVPVPVVVESVKPCPPGQAKKGRC